jgi:hypothetical protein
VISNRCVLLAALGGGGDVIAAAMVAKSCLCRGMVPVLVSLAWERFTKDSRPGPRRVSELSHVERVSDVLCRVTCDTAFPEGALTNQAVISARLGIEHNFILDPYGGVPSLMAGIQELGEEFDFGSILGVDVGGDVLAETPVDSLRSPLADALMLAALYRCHDEARVVVIGLGADGELPQDLLLAMVARHLQANLVEEVVTLPQGAVTEVALLLKERMLDSEATAIVVGAYRGLHGNVLMRDVGSVVAADLSLLPVVVYRARDVCERVNELARALWDVDSIGKASEIVEALGYASEWRYEHEKATRLGGAYPPVGMEELRPRVSALLEEIRGGHPTVQFVAERYLAERLKVDVKCVRLIVDRLSAEGCIDSWPPFLSVPPVQGHGASRDDVRS